MTNSLNQVCYSLRLSFCLTVFFSDCQATDQLPSIKWAQRVEEKDPTVLDHGRLEKRRATFVYAVSSPQDLTVNIAESLGLLKGKDKVLIHPPSQSILESSTKFLKDQSFFLLNTITQDIPLNHLIFQENFDLRIELLTKKILRKQRKKQYLEKFSTDSFFLFGDEMKASVEQLDDDIAGLKARLSKVIQSAKIIASCPFEPYPVRLKRENQIYGHLYTLESPDA